MSQTKESVIEPLIKALRNAFQRAGLDCRVTPVTSIAAEPGLYEWHRAQFEGADEFQLYTGTRLQRDEQDQPVTEQIQNRLQVALSGFEADPFGEFHGRTLGSVAFESIPALPDSLGVLLQIDGTHSQDRYIVALDSPSVTWFTANFKSQAGAPRTIMDTLMDVELPVSILLATREASLGDVLQWGPGAIVEFDAGLGDPVDVIVNKQRVARGSVVLVDGNYGIRITEVFAGPAILTTN
jgi:flagellar motor switch protein FliN